VAACDISTGDLLNESNLTIKRPGSGLNPMFWDEICGTTATRNYKADEPI
jgi:N,N'-diacetyllegionaminate synthase